MAAKQSRRLQEIPAKDVNCLALGRKLGHRILLVTGGNNYRVNVWEGSRLKFQTSFGHNSPVEVVQFGITNETVAAGSRSGAVKIWDTESQEVLQTLKGFTSSVQSLEFHPTGNIVAISSGESVKLWHWKEGRKSSTLFEGNKNPIQQLRFSSDGRWVASAGEDGHLKIWDLNAGKMFADLKGHSGTVTACDFHPNRNLLASSSLDKVVKFWDLNNSKLIGTTEASSRPAKSILFHPDGHCLYTGVYDYLKIYGWDPVQCYESNRIGWGEVSDISVTENQLIGASYSKTKITTFLVDLQPSGLSADVDKFPRGPQTPILARPLPQSNKLMSTPVNILRNGHAVFLSETRSANSTPLMIKKSMQNEKRQSLAVADKSDPVRTPSPRRSFNAVRKSFNAGSSPKPETVSLVSMKLDQSDSRRNSTISSRITHSRDTSISSIRQIHPEKSMISKKLEKEVKNNISSKKLLKDVHNNKISDTVADSNKLNKSKNVSAEEREKKSKRKSKIPDPLLTPLVSRHSSSKKERVGKSRRTPKEKSTQVEIEYKDNATEMVTVSDDKETQVEHLNLIDYRSCATQTALNQITVNGHRLSTGSTNTDGTDPFNFSEEDAFKPRPRLGSAYTNGTDFMNLSQEEAFKHRPKLQRSNSTGPTVLNPEYCLSALAGCRVCDIEYGTQEDHYFASPWLKCSHLHCTWWCHARCLHLNLTFPDTEDGRKQCHQWAMEKIYCDRHMPKK